MQAIEGNIARVTEEHRTRYVITTAHGERSAVVRGKLHYATVEKGEFPKVGDYVTFMPIGDDQATIETILPRTTVLTRKTAEDNERQVMVANVDVMFIVMGLDLDFNIRRLERYLSLAEQSGVRGVVVLNKTDLVRDSEEKKNLVIRISGDTPVHVVSAVTGEGMESLRTYIGADTTVVLLGSSGAGKSTMTNWILNSARQATQGIREDDGKGRHTTTQRQLFSIPTGGYLIDTPGMRELAVGITEDEESNVFEDIEILARSCRFPDCDHVKSAGCKIQEAIANGSLDESRFHSYQKLQREQKFLASKVDDEAEYERKQQVKKIHKQRNKFLKRMFGDRERYF